MGRGRPSIRGHLQVALPRSPPIPRPPVMSARPQAPCASVLYDSLSRVHEMGSESVEGFPVFSGHTVHSNLPISTVVLCLSLADGQVCSRQTQCSPADCRPVLCLRGAPRARLAAVAWSPSCACVCKSGARETSSLLTNARWSPLCLVAGFI